MTSFLLLLALATLITHVATAIQVLADSRSIRSLRDLLPRVWWDGIDWRGTHYSLAELKANKV